MKLLIGIVLVMAVVAMGTTFEIGSDQYITAIPFGAEVCESLRYQTLINLGEFSGWMNIESIEFTNPSMGGSVVTLDGFNIYMGYCESDSLNPTYELNYIPGTKTNVLSCGNPISIYRTDITLNLEQPFYLTSSNGNLILDIQWDSGQGEIYTYCCVSETQSMVWGPVLDPYGFAYNHIPHLLLHSGTSMNRITWASTKSSGW